MVKQVLTASLLATLIFAALPGTAGADWGKEQIQVYCYLGSRDDNEYVGIVDVFVNAIGRAAAYCNMMYNDCNANCTGCYDDESSREICADSSGARYYHN
jgi:hypothetical protein